MRLVPVKRRWRWRWRWSMGVIFVVKVRQEMSTLLVTNLRPRQAMSEKVAQTFVFIFVFFNITITITATIQFSIPRALLSLICYLCSSLPCSPSQSLPSVRAPSALCALLSVRLCLPSFFFLVLLASSSSFFVFLLLRKIINLHFNWTRIVNGQSQF